MGSGGHISFSPDRGIIMDVAGHRELLTLRIDGSVARAEAVQVFRFDDSAIRIDYPKWSPDGRWALFDRVDPRGGDIWLVEGLREPQTDEANDS